MIAFIIGLVVGGISGGLTYNHTGDGGLATIVGIVCWLLAWIIGVAIFTDGDGWDFDF